MEKLGYMKSATQRFTQSLRPAQYLKQPRFEDKILKVGPDFKHSWANMAHMHDLRLWTITYAPNTKTNIRRI